ncbi:MAG: DNA cytosine methyltransferase [Bacteroidetes bacterium]|nr:DNA cytosine methyltransferase [Bacteroidota bacterium]
MNTIKISNEQPDTSIVPETSDISHLDDPFRNDQPVNGTPNLIIPHSVSPVFDSVSLFTGVGGMDLGVHQAGSTDTGIIKVRLAVDNWKASQQNYPLNFEGDFLCKDILKVPGDEILERVGKRQGELHNIHGGAPCPGWSALNRKRNKGHASLLETNLLTFKFVSLISEMQPHSFCMEQVDGMGDQAVINGFHELKMRFKDDLKNYVIEVRKVNTLSRSATKKNAMDIYWLAARHWSITSVS